MLVRRKPAHVGPDLGDDDLRPEILDTRDRHDLLDCGLEGSKDPLHLRLDRGNGCIESVNLIEMKAQQETMVVCHPTTKGLAELLVRRFYPPIMFGRAERDGLSLGLVLPLGVVTVLTRQALPIRTRLHGDSRDDGIGAPRSADPAHVVRLQKNKTTLKLN
jgi:hypothetical protein